MQKEKLIGELKKIIGKEKVITEPAVLKINASDYVGYRRAEKYGKNTYLADSPVCIVKPVNTSEVSKLLKFLNRNNINCVPRTGATCVTAGLETSKDSVVIDGSDMNEIINFNEEDMQTTAKCGTPLEQIEDYVRKKGYTLGHSPQSYPIAHIGGLVATRSTGQLSTLYGGIEDMVVGLEAVLADGEIIRIKNVPRRATGPDLRHIFIGSEGALAFITEVTVKVFKYYPKNRWIRAYAVPDMQVGLDILREIMIKGYRPAIARLHDNNEVLYYYSEFAREGESVLFFAVDGPKGIVDGTSKAIEKISANYGARDIGTKLVKVWLEHRFDACDQMEDNEWLRAGCVGDTCEISGNWSVIGKIYKSVINKVKKNIDKLLLMGGHSSHSYQNGTNIYFVFKYKAPDDPIKIKESYYELLKIIMEETLKFGGSISHHHGIGKYRTPWMKQEHGSSYILLKKLKNMMDPNNIMNKGCLIGK